MERKVNVDAFDGQWGGAQFICLALLKQAQTIAVELCDQLQSLACLVLARRQLEAHTTGRALDGVTSLGEQGRKLDQIELSARQQLAFRPAHSGWRERRLGDLELIRYQLRSADL